MQASGQIGPNAITRMAEALNETGGAALRQQLFERAGLSYYLVQPPEHMVEQDEVRSLHLAVYGQLAPDQAAEVARTAGAATGNYLLAHRIPNPLQAVLKRLPASLAARVLLAAISRHAWTFVGSGRFVARPPAWHAAGVMVTIHDNPLCSHRHSPVPVCHFHAATFERLFAALVHPATRVSEQHCEASGGDACCFEIRWGQGPIAV
jgi:divinyl protochlorophyllide a 8-vinyl-reductase